MTNNTTLIGEITEIRRLMQELIEQYSQVQVHLSELSDQVELDRAQKDLIHHS